MGGRLAAAVGLAVLGFAAGRFTAGQVQERGWAAYDGRDWRGFAPAEKRAYVIGFLTGGAVADAGRVGAEGPAAVAKKIDSLSRGGGLRFPFGHTVYQTQLDEYYWWENHVPTRLYLALWDINRRLATHER
jgi:hypothetical protein